MKQYLHIILTIIAFGILFIFGGCSDSGSPSDPEPATWSKDIALIFNANCISCHNTQAKAGNGNLDLSSYATLMQGGISGAVIVAGEPDSSLLVNRIENDNPPREPRMPFGGSPLSASQISKIREWISNGSMDN